MIRACAALLLLSEPLSAQSLDEVFQLTGAAGQNVQQFSDTVMAVFPGAEVTYARGADEVPQALADPHYFHLEFVRFDGHSLTDFPLITAISCSQLGRASLERLNAAQSGDLGGQLPNFRYHGVTLREDAKLMLSCLFQFQSMDPLVPYDHATAVEMMEAYPGETQHRVRPDGGTMPGDVGWSNWWERRTTQSTDGEVVVSPLGFLNGFLGQDVQFVAQRLR